MDRTKSSLVKPNPKPVSVFFVWYSELCRRLNLQPSSAIRPTRAKCQTILDFVADRLKVEEWVPVTNALKLDTSLHVIAVRNRIGNCQFLHDIDSEEKAKNTKRKFGTIWTAYVLKQLLKSISSCLRITEVLTYLELDGLPLFMQYLEPLMQALKKNSTLKTFSLSNCNIQDAGCQMVCSYLRFIPNIEVINLSGCSLSSMSGEYLAKLIKYQQINRYCESWHTSLRYENPDTGKMRGIKRISINCNQFFSDVGIAFILNELEDDLWIKALDVQKCGITENIADRIIEVVKSNNTLEIFDLRQNDALTLSSMENIFQLLRQRQTNGFQPEYQWCNTAVSLMYSTVGSSVSKTTVGTHQNIHKTRSAPIKKPSTRGNTPRYEHAVRKTRTVDSIPKAAPRSSSLKDTKKQVLELNDRLQKEIQKRKEVEKINAELHSQLIQIQTATNLSSKKSVGVIPKNGVRHIKLQKEDHKQVSRRKHEEPMDLRQQNPMVIRRKEGAAKMEKKEQTKAMLVKNGYHKNGVTNGVANGVIIPQHMNGFPKNIPRSNAFDIFEKLLKNGHVIDNNVDQELKQYFLQNFVSHKNTQNHRKEKNEELDTSSQISLYHYMEELKIGKT